MEVSGYLISIFLFLDTISLKKSMVIIDTTKQICQACSSVNVFTFRLMKCVFTITGTCSIQFYLLQLREQNILYLT